MMHYLIPLDPLSKARFDGSLWSSYVRANMAFVNRLVEVLWSLENDFVWIHDYHLLVLPSLLRKRFHRIKCGFFLHSPFPSSEIFRTFPRREEVLRSLLNADVIGFHTFDYARHFLSCCSRMLGLEHKTSRGSIIMEYYGRDVAIKIMPTGVNPDRWLSACSWADTQWRIGELRAEYKDKMVLIGVDDMDVFKGIELKLAAFQEVLVHHPEWRGKLVLIQVRDVFLRRVSGTVTTMIEDETVCLPFSSIPPHSFAHSLSAPAPTIRQTGDVCPEGVRQGPGGASRLRNKSGPVNQRPVRQRGGELPAGRLARAARAHIREDRALLDCGRRRRHCDQGRHEFDALRVHCMQGGGGGTQHDGRQRVRRVLAEPQWGHPGQPVEH